MGPAAALVQMTCGSPRGASDRLHVSVFLNPGLLRGIRILYQLSHEGSPRILERVAHPFSRGFS